MELATCIGCGCDDYHACFDEEVGRPCNWIAVSYDEGLGVCSCCKDHFERFHAGDREIAVPVEMPLPLSSRIHRFAMVFLFLILPGLSFAGEDTIASLAALKSQLAVLNAQIAVAKARNDLAALDHVGSPVSYSTGIDHEYPKIVSISGSGSSLSAVLEEHGAQFRVSRGSRLGAYLVESIDHDGVTVRHGKQRRQLEFAPFTDQSGTGARPLPQSPIPQ